ncbi:hypothetical protein M378DRAFT_284401 [Amanita muscaria Koide BX008]|uniref:Uncharacterized protein n=1 Tax=Amanita muscaria (strain Koide BX008) TaxID=946122 RepID=A0A0C2WCL8_AMAMK|nr:hypothetical protein M378DRAFT_284401 [Amanita muscaria Koide BX008]
MVRTENLLSRADNHRRHHNPKNNTSESLRIQHLALRLCDRALHEFSYKTRQLIVSLTVPAV